MKPVVIAVLCLFLVLAVSSFAGAGKWKEERTPTEPSPELVARGDLDCTGAIPIEIGQTIWSTNVGAPTNVDLYPTCTDEWDESGGEVVFELTVQDYADIGISLWYRVDMCDLDWFLLEDCDEDGDCVEYDDYGWPVDSIEPGTYYLVVDGYEGDECAFAIAVYMNEGIDGCGPLTSVCHTWDFNAVEPTLTHADCGFPQDVWEWGAAPGALPDTACGGETVSNVLCTGLSGTYPAEGGEGIYLDAVMLSEGCTCLEVCHFYDIRGGYDGGMVGLTTDGGATWSLLTPARGYDDIGDWDNTCIGPWPCFTGEGMMEFRVDHFDLTPWAGQSVSIGFFFGSDSSSAALGWFILYAAIGSSESAVEQGSWGSIKALYR
jgi:hypothetical protein